jgi:hypothetical protein
VLHRSITLIHLAFLLFAALLSFLVIRAYEEMATTVPAGIVWISGNDDTADIAQIVDTVEDFTEHTGVSVGLQLPDLRDPGSIRHLYLASGEPGSLAADWVEEGYPSFGHSMHTEVHPFDELDRSDPRGFYLVFGTEEDTAAFETALAGIGLHDTNSAGGHVMHWTDFFLYGGDLSTALIIILLFGVTVSGSGVLLNAKTYGVLRLQGYSYGRILVHDLVQLFRFHLIVGGCVTAGIIAALLLYNGLAQFALFTRIAGWLLALFLLTGLLAHALALALLHTTDIPGALKGRIPARLAGTSAYLVRTPALVLVLTVIGSVVVSAQNVRSQQESFDTFDQAGQASRIMLSGSVDFTEMDEVMDPLIGGWLRQADTEGQIILTAQERGEVIAPQGAPRPDFDVLVVNDTYLEHEEVLSPTGERYGTADSVRVLLPVSLADQEEAIAQGAGRWVEFASGSESNAVIDIETLPVAEGQQIFTYGSTKPGELHSQPFLDDPVIIALPNGAVLSDFNYTVYATQAAIVFPDPDVVEESIAHPPFSTYINGLQMVVTSAADHHSDLVRDLRLQTFNLAAATSVLLMTAVAVCIIHIRTQAQTIFARHISGWSFASTHRRLLIIEGLLALAFVGWIAWRTVIRLERQADPSQPVPVSPEASITGLEPLLALAIASAGLLLILAALAYFHRRIVREGASQA